MTKVHMRSGSACVAHLLQGHAALPAQQRGEGQNCVDVPRQLQQRILSASAACRPNSLCYIWQSWQQHTLGGCTFPKQESIGWAAVWQSWQPYMVHVGWLNLSQAEVNRLRWVWQTGSNVWGPNRPYCSTPTQGIWQTSMLPCNKGS